MREKVACFAILLVLLNGVCLGGAAGSDQKGTSRLVFAHYMACCPRGGLAGADDSFRSEIRDAVRLGVDGFAVNIGSWRREDKYIRIPKLLFDAAELESVNFRLFFSFDNLASDEAVETIKLFGNRANYFRIDGKIVVSSYGGDPAWGQAVRAGLKAAGIEILLIPFYHYAHADIRARFDPLGRDAYIAKTALDEAKDIDGYFYFGAAASDPQLADQVRAIGEIIKKSDRLSMLGVSPFYKGFGPKNSRVFESHGFESMQRQWIAAIETNADFVELVTWNDWGEATYLAPIVDASFQAAWKQHWGTLLAHDAFLAASHYYIRWFKQRSQPQIIEDHVFYFYRIHPKTALGYVQLEARELGQPTNAGSLEDAFYLTSILTAPAELHYRIGSEERKQSLPSGVFNVRLPFSLGPVELSLHRNGEEIAKKTLEHEITTDGTRGNFNYFSGTLEVRTTPADPAQRK